MKKKYLLLVTLCFVFFTCSFDTSTQVAHFQKKEKEWTFLVYMAADNNLEAAAIRDFNELESVKLDKTVISILVLLDRSPYYDNSNGNWVGTRLYEVVYDYHGLDNIIRSKEIDCPVLDIGPGKETNLNVADPVVLEKTIDFVQERYKAKNFGFIMWGHGTGWRSGNARQCNILASYDNQDIITKAFAFDDTSDSYMIISDFRKAITNKAFSLIAFDTCFAGVLELVYEIKDETELVIASPATVSIEGWDYKCLFENFIHSDLSLEGFSAAAHAQFEKQYGQEETAVLSSIETTKIKELKELFDTFAKNLAGNITNIDERENCFNWILHKTVQYKEHIARTDLFIDIASFVLEACESYDNLESSGNLVLEKLKESIPLSYSTRASDYPSLGIFFSSVENGVLVACHPASYVQGSDSFDHSLFVQESDGWVPHAIGGDSFLDLLFYTIF